MTKLIRTKERDTILQSLRTGVTPSIGIQHIQVGRIKEINALDGDINRIVDGGAAFRFIIGEFGSGKTFFLNLVKNIALEKKLVTVSADLSPDRRIHASQGQARSLYSELMKNISTRTKPDGNAMVSIVEKFITKAMGEAKSQNIDTVIVINNELAEISDYVGGYDFTSVISSYYQGYLDSNEKLKSNAIRWLRAEFTTKRQALKALGVRSIITDNNFYDSLKLMSLFVVKAGYNGMLINLDEMVNVFKLHNSQARSSNYEQILRILNDCIQGNASNIGFILGGTPEFLFDERKGLYSYEALRSRLSENTFAKDAGVVDYDSPALQLSNLAPEELYVLLKNIRHVYAQGKVEDYLVEDKCLETFLFHCNKTIGSAYFKTPRNTIKSFIDLLSVLDTSPELTFGDLIKSVNIDSESLSDDTIPNEKKENSLTEFSL